MHLRSIADGLCDVDRALATSTAVAPLSLSAFCQSQKRFECDDLIHLANNRPSNTDFTDFEPLEAGGCRSAHKAVQRQRAEHHTISTGVSTCKSNLLYQRCLRLINLSLN